MTNILSNEDQSALSILASGLRPFREMGTATNSNFPISLVAAFMLVASAEGKTVSELAKIAGVNLAKMSRSLADLSSVNRYGAPGLGLIEQRVDIQDNRFMRSRLTEKGRTLVGQIANAMVRRPIKAAA
jgi:DNA-binding MarR family transcriptional regulator